MKTTVEIPADELADAIRFTQAPTAREASVSAVREYHRRKRMTELLQHAGTCTALFSVEDLQAQRRQGPGNSL